MDLIFHNYWKCIARVTLSSDVIVFIPNSLLIYYSPCSTFPIVNLQVRAHKEIGAKDEKH